MSKAIISIALAIAALAYTGDYILNRWLITIQPRRQVIRLADSRDNKKRINKIKYAQEFAECIRLAQYQDDAAIACERFATKRALE